MSKKVLDNQCPACKAPLKFNAKLGKFKCEYCESEFTMEELKEKTAASKEISHQEEKTRKGSNKYDQYHCSDCGALIVTDEHTSATFCVYCGNTSIIKERVTGKFAPSRIIPFKCEKNDAIEAFKKINKGRPFMPKFFNDEKNIEKIRGVYIPFWLYSFEVSGSIKMEAKNIRSWTSGNTHYTKTDIYHVIRGGNMEYAMVPVDGSTHFANDMMNSLEPFHFNEFKEYNHAYLSGFLAEKYDVSSEEAFSDAKNRALNSATNYLSSQVNYTNKRVLENHLQEKNVRSEYVLLPVYMVNIKYKDKMYLFAMNGQTGEFIGDIPLDKKKVLISAILLFLILFLCILLGSYLLYLVGGNV